MQETQPQLIDEGRSSFQCAAEEGAAASSSPRTATNPVDARTRRPGRPGANTPDWAPGFLRALADGMSVTHAARRAGVHVTSVYERRRKDEVFACAWREAAQIGTELLEEEAARRAYHGTLKPV